jgi:hypothetical protein
VEEILKDLKKGQYELRESQQELRDSHHGLRELVDSIRASQEATRVELEGFRKETQQNFEYLAHQMRLLESDFELLGKKQFENEPEINRIKSMIQQ